MSLAAAVKVDKVAYQGWPNCYRVSNGEMEAIVTGDIGPRVMRFGFVGGQNFFKEFGEQLGKTGEEKFQLRGGHRVGRRPRTPSPPGPRITRRWRCASPKRRGGARAGRAAHRPSKRDRRGHGTLRHERDGDPSHRQQDPVHPGIRPLGYDHAGARRPGDHRLPPRGKHPDNLEVTNPLSMWAYTDLSDKRLTLTRKYLLLRQDPNNAQPQKVGLFNPKTGPPTCWTATCF